MLKRSKAAFDCFALIADTLPPPSTPSSGVSGGVGSSLTSGARGISLGAAAIGKGNSASNVLFSGGGVGGYTIESENFSGPNDSVDERSDEGEEGEKDGVRLSVTQSDDPRSGGHFVKGTSKTPLWKERHQSSEV